MLSSIISLSILGLTSLVNGEKQRLDNRASTATVYTTCKTKGTFAITYDDGPYDYEDEIAKLLTAHNVTGTFFLNGNNWACIYDRADQVRAAYANGANLIGSHTWSHADLTTLTATEMRQQLDLTETALKKILGIKPKYFRPPYGSYNDQVLEVLAEYNYNVIIWDVDTEDADGASLAYSEEQYDNFVKAHPKGSSHGIGLEHSPYLSTASKLTPYAIKALQAAGYKVVTVAECLGFSKSDWYQSVGAPTARDSTWTCDGTPSGK